jgi:hypothetical protein
MTPFLQKGILTSRRTALYWDRGRLARLSAKRAREQPDARTSTVDDSDQSILSPASNVRASRFSGRDARGPSERASRFSGRDARGPSERAPNSPDDSCSAMVMTIVQWL